MAAHLGAHETMEVHEILCSAIAGINTMQLYRPHVKDQRLAQIMDKQMQFTINEYNQMVQSVQHLSGQGMAQGTPYRAPSNFQPVYGLDNPAASTPNMSANQIDDRDVSSALLAFHKSSAMMKIIAALECANPQIRSMMQQGAVNCSEQAYEIWQYMNQAGYYQVPTMKEMTTNTVLNHYEPASGMGMPNMTNMANMVTPQSNLYQPNTNTVRPTLPQ
ncbi:spore coat protein [Paenibacillus nanensis]|uniref:Spore coat protein n=1 Tax=Paenibacillus nanensis TaxID=393251 RepID=A0A3A1VGW2_9BACL|nr:spore coat protein [Paenibacillus nanensis]RIX60149.1 spore coat protein [Paenibacillus nanensis]